MTKHEENLKTAMQYDIGDIGGKCITWAKQMCHNRGRRFISGRWVLRIGINLK